jgi:hypothetical protein
MRNKLSTISRSGKILLALATAVGCFGVATAVQAAIPAANGTISGCYAKAGGPNQGALRVVDQGNACKPGEAPLTWNQVGQPGPAGPAGPGVTTVAGFVNGNVDTYGKGFTVQKMGTGWYRLDFPNSEFTDFPAVAVSAWGLPGFAPTVNVASNSHPGPWQVDIFVTKPDGQTPTDSAFQFVAAQVSN